MDVFTGSEVDHTPPKSATKGQLPISLTASENCAWFPGAAALGFATAFSGMITLLIVQLLLEVPQAASKPHESSRGNSPGLSHIVISSAWDNLTLSTQSWDSPAPFSGCI